MADTAVSYRGTGKRKTSVARVVLVPGAGAITVNGKAIEEYFHEIRPKRAVIVIRIWGAAGASIAS